MPENATTPDARTPAGESAFERLRRRAGFWTGIAAFALFQFFVELDPERPSVSTAAAVASLMAIWWMTEAFPLSRRMRTAWTRSDPIEAPER